MENQARVPALLLMLLIDNIHLRIVGLSEVGIDICNSRVWFNLSKPAQKFIKDFDNGLIIKPSTFIITKK